MAEPAADQVGSRLSAKGRELVARGQNAVRTLPTAEKLAALPDGVRHERLESLRVELYGISSVLAEATVERAYRDRAERPPYGLVRSGHTEWRMMLDEPRPVNKGDIDGFYVLGRAYVDTMVFHLHREFQELPQSDRAWMFDRLEDLLALFRMGAGPQAKARMRDALSFIYGGLHFGTGVSVQLAELMNRMLDGYGLAPDDKVEVMLRSSRPAMRFAALNLDHVIVAYTSFLGAPSFPGGPQWFDAAHFEVHEVDGRPRAIDVRPDELQAGKPHTARIAAVKPTWATHGCPARVSPSGAATPIQRLWTWAVELARDTGLLESTATNQPTGPPTTG
ncbi:MAG: hypothetical protein ACRD2W_21735 [Acidimicrobiales bacterium]